MACTNNMTIFMGTANDRDLVTKPPLYYILAVAYVATAVGSALGNGGVLIVVLCKKDMRSVTNIFISSLAMADLIVTATTFWVTPLQFTRQVFGFGKPMCYMSVGLGGACFFWTPFILTAMAADRYAMVMMPLQKRITRLQCLGLVVLIAVGGMVMVIPPIYHLQYLHLNECQQYCIEVWRDPGRLVYGIFVLILRSVVPFVVITFCHCRIANRLEEQEQRLNEHRTTLRRAQESQRKKRLERLLVLMVLVFTISTFPLDIYNILQDYEQAFPDREFMHRAGPILHLLTFLIAMTGTLWNPLIYAWWNENFKREMFAVMDCSQKRFSVMGAAVISRSVLGRRSLTRGTGKGDGSRTGSSNQEEKQSLLGNGHRTARKPSLTQSTKPTSLQSYSSTSDIHRIQSRSGTGNASLLLQNVPDCEWRGKAIGVPYMSNPPTPSWVHLEDPEAIEEVSE